MAQPDNFSLYPAARGRRALDGRPRAARLASVVRRWPGCSPGLATLARNDGAARPGGARPRLPLGSLARRWRVPAADRRRAGRDPDLGGRSAALAVFVLVMAPWWAAPARGLRLAVAVDRVGQGAVHPRHRRVEQHHDPGHAGPPARAWGSARCSRRRIGGLVAAIDDLRRRSSCGVVLAPSAGRRRVGAAPLAGLRAVLRLRRDPVRASRPSSRPSTCPGGTFIHSAVALAPHSYILALEGIGVAVGLDRRPPADLGRRRGRRASSARGDRRVRARHRGRSGSLARPRRLGALGATTASRSPPRSTRRGRRPTDRVMSIDAAGYEVLDRPRRRRPRQRPARHDPRGRRAYDIRWLVLDRGDAVAVGRARSSTATSGRPGSARRSTPIAAATGGAPASLASTRSA